MKSNNKDDLMLLKNPGKINFVDDRIFCFFDECWITVDLNLFSVLGASLSSREVLDCIRLLSKYLITIWFVLSKRKIEWNKNVKWQNNNILTVLI